MNEDDINTVRTAFFQFFMEPLKNFGRYITENMNLDFEQFFD
jgi:hypothetical protein